MTELPLSHLIEHSIQIAWDYLERTGELDVAVEPHQVDWLREGVREARDLGHDSVFLDQSEVRAEVNSPTYLAGAPGDTHRLFVLEKAGRIIDLKPLSDVPQKVKSIFDPADILVVDDKPVIIQQIRDGLRHTPWKIHGIASQGEAIDFCSRTPPDLVIASLSLPDESAFALFRLLRTNPKSKRW